MITEALLVQEAGAPFSYQEINANDNLRDNEVLVEMRATGVSLQNINFAEEKTLRVTFPAVFGHEGETLVAYMALISSPPYNYL
jgi:aryl-alcohol dehydrogenase